VVENSDTKQVEVGPPVHLALEQLDPGHLPLRLPVAIREGQSGFDSGLILTQAFSGANKFRNPAGDRRLKPGVQVGRAPLPHKAAELSGQLGCRLDGRGYLQQVGDDRTLAWLQIRVVGEEPPGDLPGRWHAAIGWRRARWTGWSPHGIAPPPGHRPPACHVVLHRGPSPREAACSQLAPECADVLFACSPAFAEMGIKPCYLAAPPSAIVSRRTTGTEIAADGLPMDTELCLDSAHARTCCLQALDLVEALLPAVGARLAPACALAGRWRRRRWGWRSSVCLERHSLDRLSECTLVAGDNPLQRLRQIVEQMPAVGGLPGLRRAPARSFRYLRWRNEGQHGPAGFHRRL